MRFEEVLPALRDGKKIRRPSTPFVFVGPHRFAIDDVLADDWEIVEEKPLPCPFCGGKARWATAETDVKVYVYCPDCRATGPKYFDNFDKAAELWNKAKR